MILILALNKKRISLWNLALSMPLRLLVQQLSQCRSKLLLGGFRLVRSNNDASVLLLEKLAVLGRASSRNTLTCIVIIDINIRFGRRVRARVIQLVRNNLRICGCHLLRVRSAEKIVLSRDFPLASSIIRTCVVYLSVIYCELVGRICLLVLILRLDRLDSKRASNNTTRIKSDTESLSRIE